MPPRSWQYHYLKNAAYDIIFGAATPEMAVPLVLSEVELMCSPIRGRSQDFINAGPGKRLKPTHPQILFLLIFRSLFGILKKNLKAYLKSFCPKRGRSLPLGCTGEQII